MDPISLAIGAIGMGVSAFGMFGASSAAKQASNIQNAILANETAENQVRQQAVNMQAQRSQIQNVRNTQRAQAQGLSVGVSQGAQFGSGVAGGQAQAATAGAWNAEGIDQSILSANKVFGYDYAIDSLKGQLGSTESTLAQDRGIQGMGMSIFGAAGAAGRLFAPGSGRSPGAGGMGTDPTYSNYGYNFT